MSLTSKIVITPAIDYKTTLDAGNAQFKPGLSYSNTLANGTGANQAQTVFTDQRTLAGTTSEDLDLAGGLTDAFGATITFTKVKANIVTAAAANGGDIEVGGAASNGFAAWVGAAADYIVIPAGGLFAISAPDATGFAVTAGTGDLLKINNTDGSTATYDIVIIGV